MKRLWIALTISLLLQAVTFAEEKETFTSGDYEYTLLDDGTAEITKYIGGEKNPEVASELDGHAVTYIGKYAFKVIEFVGESGLLE